MLVEIGNGRSGYLEMPYHAAPSMWAFAPIHAKTTFIVIVPRETIDRSPPKIASAVRALANDELLDHGLHLVGRRLLAILSALLGSRRFTRPTLQLVDASNRLSRGDFSVRVGLRTGDERDRLVQAFNDMVLKLANEIQQNLLPQGEPFIPELDIAGISLYCDETGSDY